MGEIGACAVKHFVGSAGSGRVTKLDSWRGSGTSEVRSDRLAKLVKKERRLLSERELTVVEQTNPN